MARTCLTSARPGSAPLTTYYTTTYCLLLTTDYSLPAMFCSTRFGTNQDNPSDPSDMNEDGPVRDQ
eukprot:scaffold100211_cov45-Phaeocystis_antarctica.AAC.1